MQRCQEKKEVPKREDLPVEKVCGEQRAKDKVTCLFKKVGLLKYFPQTLSLQDALTIQEDTLQFSQNYTPLLAPFIMLQKMMAFDSKCRITLDPDNKIIYSGESDSESEDDKSIHPVDGLLALIHCSDAFLRQDLFYRLAVCQIAVPLVLPIPHKSNPVLLLWALKSIIKEFKLPGDKVYNGGIINFPTPYVSFLRLGSHTISKSEILNMVMKPNDSDDNHRPFFGYNFPGGTAEKILMNGVVELSWYLPGDGLFTKPISFTNLRGDASDPELQ